jgi:hypothetical protein
MMLVSYGSQKILFALESGWRAVTLDVSGAGVEAVPLGGHDLFRIWARSSAKAGQLPEPGLWIWEGFITVYDTVAVDYFAGTLRRPEPWEYARLASTHNRLWGDDGKTESELMGINVHSGPVQALWCAGCHVFKRESELVEETRLELYARLNQDATR